MNTAAKIAQTNNERGNNLDPLFGTCLGKMNVEALKRMVTYERTKLAVQDGVDFFECSYYKGQPSSHHLARYEWPFLRRWEDPNKGQAEEAAAQEAAAMFLRDNPEYKLAGLE